MKTQRPDTATASGRFLLGNGRTVEVCKLWVAVVMVAQRNALEQVRLVIASEHAGVRALAESPFTLEGPVKIGIDNSSEFTRRTASGIMGNAPLSA